MPDEKDFGAEIQALNAKIEAMGQSVQTVTGMFEKMLGHIQQPTAPKDEPKGPTLPDAEAIEGMSNGDLVNLVMTQVGHALTEQQKALSEQITGLGKTLAAQRGEGILSYAKNKYKDFGEWEQELSAVLQNMKNPDIDEAMTIVRAKHPEKAKELDAKYNPAPVDPEEEEEAALLSLVPSRPGQPGGEPAFGKIDLDSAATAAFQKLGKGILAAQSDSEDLALIAGQNAA